MGTEPTPSGVAEHPRLAGPCLHSGEQAAVTFEPHDGPFLLCAGGRAAPRSALATARTDRGVAVRLGADGPTVDLVEHLLGALGGLGIQRGVRAVVTGSEVPLLDGGAAQHAAALSRLTAGRHAPELRVERAATFDHGRSRYTFTPADGTRLTVHVEFPEPIGHQTESWDGSPEDFVNDIAPARTFGFAREAEALRAIGRARGVDPRAVMVLDDAGRVLPPGAPMRPREIARHKLLDLIGDLYLHGGPPVGRVEALRPGHGATHAVVRRALEQGVLGPNG